MALPQPGNRRDGPWDQDPLLGVVHGPPGLIGDWDPGLCMLDANSKQGGGFMLWPDQIVSVLWLCGVEDIIL